MNEGRREDRPIPACCLDSSFIVHRSSFQGVSRMCCRRPLPFFVLLALGILGVVLRAQAQDEAKAAAEKLAADVAAGKKISEADAKAFAKKYDDLEDVMAVFKPAKKGDMTLESTLNKLAKKTSHSGAEKATLIKIANLSRAL